MLVSSCQMWRSALTCSAIWGLLDKCHSDLRASHEPLNTERILQIGAEIWLLECDRVGQAKYIENAL